MSFRHVTSWIFGDLTTPLILMLMDIFLQSSISTALKLHGMNIAEETAGHFDFNAVRFHLPFPKLGLKGINSSFRKILKKEAKKNSLENFHSSIVYSQKIGNIFRCVLSIWDFLKSQTPNLEMKTSLKQKLELQKIFIKNRKFQG